MHPETRKHPAGEAPAILAIGGYLLKYGVVLGDVEGACGVFDEIFLPRAFERCISGQADVVATVTFEDGETLTFRRSEGTLSLKEELDGVSYALRVPEGVEEGGGGRGQKLLAAASRLRPALTFVVEVKGERWREVPGAGKIREIQAAVLTSVAFQVSSFQ